MTKVTNTQTKAELTEAILAQLVRLLEEHPLVPMQHLRADGPGLILDVDVWPSEESPDRFDALVGAFSPDGRRYDLQHLAIWACGDLPEARVLHMGRPTSYGTIALDGLWTHVREYRLAVPKIPVRSEGEVLLLREGREVEWASKKGMTEEEKLREALSRPVYRSADGRVAATVQVEENGETVVVIETEAPELAGATARIMFVGIESGRIHYETVQVLAPTDRPQLWGYHGPLGKRLVVPEACELIIDVGSPSPKASK